MTIFPTQHSTLSAQALNGYLAQAYGFRNTSCRLLIRNVSDTYILESDTDKFIFKIYRSAHRKVEEIKGEVELLTALKAGGASVSYPLSDVNGQQLQFFNAAEGTRCGVLFSWAAGEVVPMMNNVQLQTLGREMAKVHKISAGVKLKQLRKPYNIITTLTHPLQTVAPAFIDLPEAYHYLTTTGAQVTKSLKAADLAYFEEGYLQFDFLPKNFHFNGDDQLTFFDFDFAGWGAVMFDVTSFYIHYFLDVYFGKMSGEEARKNFNIFLSTYQQHRPIKETELALIRELGFAWWVFYLGFQYENYDDWSNYFFTPRYLRDRTALIKSWMEHKLFL